MMEPPWVPPRSPHSAGLSHPRGVWLRWAFVLFFGALVVSCTSCIVLIGFVQASPGVGSVALLAALVFAPISDGYLILLDPLEHEPP